MSTGGLLVTRIRELIKLLQEFGYVAWSEELQEIVLRSERSRSDSRLKSDVRGLFGAMGSLTDIQIHVEGDRKRAEKANKELGGMLDDIFELVSCVEPD